MLQQPALLVNSHRTDRLRQLMATQKNRSLRMKTLLAEETLLHFAQIWWQCLALSYIDCVQEDIASHGLLLLGGSLTPQLVYLLTAWLLLTEKALRLWCWAAQTKAWPLHWLPAGLFGLQQLEQVCQELWVPQMLPSGLLLPPCCLSRQQGLPLQGSEVEGQQQMYLRLSKG